MKFRVNFEWIIDFEGDIGSLRIIGVESPDGSEIEDVYEKKFNWPDEGQTLWALDPESKKKYQVRVLPALGGLYFEAWEVEELPGWLS